jgi:serine/threonine protein kinase
MSSGSGSVKSARDAKPAPRDAATVTPTPEPRSPSGRRRGDSAQALDFAKVEQIGRFGLIREIARGGMGQVFLARDTKLGRKVAIKFLLRDDPTFVPRFLVEARATARCTHENIVTIYEVGEHAGLPYMVLEYLEGKTLSEVLEGKPSMRQFVELMIPVARALERAHEDGIVHRDLKPSNVFVTNRGHVKVLDFGVARLVDKQALYTKPLESVDPRELELEIDFELDDASITYTGSNSIVGTMPYMSPEQWAAADVDHLSDIWAFGIMFWRALTNVHPAGTTAPDKLRDRLLDLDTPLPSIATRAPSLPRELVAVVDRCLAKRKEHRYQSATALLADLQAVLAPKGGGDDTSPYRGLAAFGETDTKYFFGRSNEIRTAVSQLDAWPLLAVIGPSGVGKSSFVHAGLVPAVRATGGNWQVCVLRPGRMPLARLVGVLDHADQPNDAALAEQLVDAPGLFGEQLRRAARRKNQRVLVVVDQLEELFTLCDSDDARRAFLSALLAAGDDPTSPVRVVLSMRADFLDRLAGHKQFLAELSRGLFFLTTPDRDNLRETLVRPAELVGYAFEDPWIVEDLMEAASSRGALALLSFAMSRLWDARDRGRKLLTVAAYNQMGGVGGAFARHADQVAATLPSHNQMLLRAIVTRLVTPEGTRAVVDHAELLTLGADREVEQVLDHLVRARLVHVHTDPTQGATVEIVHEMLITEWPMLRRWLDDNQAVRGFLDELRQAARQWIARGKPNDLVWRGATAQDALATEARHVLDLSASEKEFLAAVRALATKTRRRKVFVLAAVFSVLGLVIAGGAVAVVLIKGAESERAREAERARDAEAEAKQKAHDADEQAKLARAAQAQVQQQLDAVRGAEVATAKAERDQRDAAAKVKVAQGEVMQSREELEKRNVELKRALADAQAEKQKAQKAAEVAHRATDEAKTAKAAVEANLARERARVKQLEAEKKKIYDGGLH